MRHSALSFGNFVALVAELWRKFVAHRTVVFPGGGGDHYQKMNHCRRRRHKISELA
jgi:hypothetical protein